MKISENQVETASALVPQVVKGKEESIANVKTEDKESSSEDENAGLTLMEIHKKKMEKGTRS